MFKSTLKEFKDNFGGEGKYLVKELDTIKKRENQMIEEFNQRFNGLVRDMTQDYRTHDKIMLEKYL